MRLILASASPRRRELMANGGFHFETAVPYGVSEISAAPDPDEVPAVNAAIKADAVAAVNPDALVIGADTVIRFGDAIIGKPHDIEDARRTLERLSGATHRVLTAVALRGPGITKDFTVTSSVTFRKLDHGTIEAYLAQVDVLDKAGSYAIQEHGDLIIERIEGDFDNIVGFPDRARNEIAAILENAQK